MNRWRRYAALLDRREDAASLAVCRILAAGTVFASLCRVWARGVAQAGWVDVAHGGMRPLHSAWLDWAGGASPRNVTALMVACLLSSALMTLGAFTRPAAVITWLVFRTLGPLNPDMTDSSDRLLINVLFILMLSGSGNAISLDAHLRGKTARVPAWPRWVLVGQLVTLYDATGLQKISAGWVPGGPLDALWYILQQSNWQRVDMRWLAPWFGVTQAITLGIWLFEQGAPLLALSVYFRETRAQPGLWRALVNALHVRELYLGAGLLMHAGIVLALDIEQFTGGVLALYACCLMPREWRALADRARIR